MLRAWVSLGEPGSALAWPKSSRPRFHRTTTLRSPKARTSAAIDSEAQISYFSMRKVGQGVLYAFAMLVSGPFLVLMFGMQGSLS